MVHCYYILLYTTHSTTRILIKERFTRDFPGKAHLREALLLHEEAMRVNRMCRELRKKDVLQAVLRSTHDRSLNKYASIDEEDDFQEVLDPPTILPSTQYQVLIANQQQPLTKPSSYFKLLCV